MISTQSGIPISDVKNDLVITQSGDFGLILETSAVNFNLLSENEQIAIISAFAGMLNSLSFPIQILVRSKRLDISSYLDRLDQAIQKQTNSMLAQMIYRYRNFVDKLIQENDVLDKQFFVVIPLWSYEIGLLKSNDQMKKALTILIPRRDHIMRQLAAVGLTSKQLDSAQLIKLFYNIYNGALSEQQIIKEEVKKEQIASVPVPTPNQPLNTQIPVPKFQYPPTLPQPSGAPIVPVMQKPLNTRTPFVIEELTEDYDRP